MTSRKSFEAAVADLRDQEIGEIAGHHLDGSLIDCYLQQTLPSEQRADAELHLVWCARCSSRVEEIRRLLADPPAIVRFPLDRIFAPAGARDPNALAAAGLERLGTRDWFNGDDIQVQVFVVGKQLQVLVTSDDAPVVGAKVTLEIGQAPGTLVREVAGATTSSLGFAALGNVPSVQRAVPFLAVRRDA